MQHYSEIGTNWRGQLLVSGGVWWPRSKTNTYSRLKRLGM